MAKPKHPQLTPAEISRVAEQVASQAAKSESAALPETQCCGKCSAFFLQDKTNMTGFCRANPPTGDGSGRGLWPWVKADEWGCRDGFQEMV